MSDVGMELDAAAEALIRGDVEQALRQLARAEGQFDSGPSIDRAEIKDRLSRLVALAQAAAQGIEDARAVISSAGASARSVTTYDRSGDARKVRLTTPVLGRF